MVEINELAILFRRKNLENGDEVFTPIKVIEGYYHETDDWFIDKNNTGYRHIQDFNVSGNCYGCRCSIGKLLSKYRSKTLAEIKKTMLEYAKKFTYTKYAEQQTEIIIENIETGKIAIFKDADTIDYNELVNGESEYDESDDESLEDVKYLTIAIKLQQKETDNSLEQKRKESTTDEKTFRITKTPKEIADEMKETIKGQDEAIDKIVTTIWYNINYPELQKKNILVIGPTGVGKTFIFEKLSKIIDIPITIFSTAGLSQAGYVGRGTEEIFEQIIIDSDGDIEKAENAIVILDEFDKIAYQGERSGSISTNGVQNELLKIIEGDKREVSLKNRGVYYLDTSHITFVGAGAFSELYEQKYFEKKKSLGFNPEPPKEIETKINSDTIVGYGLKREIVGRLPVLTELNQLNLESLKEIITESKESEFKKILTLFNSLGITCSNSDYLVEIIAKDAINRKIGARGLLGTVTDIFLPILYEVANNPQKYSELIIGESILTNKKDFVLVPKEEVKRRVKK